MKGIILLTILGFALAAPSQKRDDSCNVCTLLVDEVRTLVSQHETQASVLDYVNSACSEFDGETKDVCRALADQFSGKLFETVADHLTSQQFCEQLGGVCTVVEEEEEPVYAAISEAEEDEVEEKKLTGNPIECELCKLVVFGVDKLIKGNKSAEAINSTLEKFCNDLPDKIAPTCRDIEPKLLDIIRNGVDPETGCKVATLCAVPDTRETTKPAISCETCLSAVGAIGVQDAYAVCADMTHCAKEVVGLPEPLTNLVLERGEAHEEENVEGTFECQICKFAVVAIDKLVEENKTAATVNASLYEFCESLPGELEKDCINVEPEVFMAIMGGIDPTKACDFIKACHDSVSVIPCDVCRTTLEKVAGQEGIDICNQMTDICKDESKESADVMSELPSVLEIRDDARCEICEYIITLLDEVAQTNNSIAALNASLYEICKAMPASFKGVCTTLVPEIEKYIKAGLDPTNSCIAAKFCTAELESGFTMLTCDECNTVVEKIVPGNAVDKLARSLCHETCHHRSRRSIADQMEYWQSQAAELQQFVSDDDKADASFLECEVCKIVIRLVDQIAGENASVSTVNKTMTEICSRLTGKQLADICLQETPKLLKFMSDGIQPTNVCQAASLCDKSTEASDPEEETPDVYVNDTPSLEQILYDKGIKADDKLGDRADLKCELCEELVKVVDGALSNNATDQKINQTLDSVCSGLSVEVLKDICYSLIPAIMDTVDHGLDPDQACTLAKLCTKTAWKKHEEKKESEEEEAPKSDDEPNTLECDICKEVVQFVDSRIQDNATVKKINQTLYQVCAGIPEEQLKAMCLKQIPAIIAQMEKGGWDPEKICDAAGLCTGDMDKDKKKSSRKLIKFSETKMKKQENVDEPNTLECDLCKELIQFVDSRIQDNDTVEKINQTLYQACAEIPVDQLKTMCLKEIPAIVAQCEKGGWDPEKACEATGICTGDIDKDKKKSSQKLIKFSETEMKKQENVQKTLRCEICEAIIDEVDTVLGQNRTEAEVNATVYGLCNRLSGSFQDLCLQAAPQVVTAITNGVNYTVVCNAIGLCTSKTQQDKDKKKSSQKLIKFSETEMKKQENVQKTLRCEICEAIIDEVDTVLGQNRTEAEVNATVYGLCNRLSGSFQDLCLQAAPQVVTAITNGVNDTVACNAIGLCTSKIQQAPVPVVEDVEEMVKYVPCDTCVKTIQLVYNDMNGDYPKIKPTLAALCNNLPTQYRTMCEVFVGSDNGLFFKQFLDQLHPEVLCDAISCQ